jgi:hypothetical protein
MRGNESGREKGRGGQGIDEGIQKEWTRVRGRDTERGRQ